MIPAHEIENYRINYLDALYKELDAYKAPSRFKDVMLKMREVDYPQEDVLYFAWCMQSAVPYDSRLPEQFPALGKMKARLKDPGNKQMQRLNAFLQEHFSRVSPPSMNRRGFLRVAGAGVLGFAAAEVTDHIGMEGEDHDLASVRLVIAAAAGAVAGLLLPDFIALLQTEARMSEHQLLARELDRKLSDDFTVTNAEKDAKLTMVSIRQLDDAVYQKLHSMHPPQLNVG